MPATIHTETVTLKLGDYSHRCDWCGRVVAWEYSCLLAADDTVIIECVCRHCIGTAMVAHDRRSVARPVAEQEPTS